MSSELLIRPVARIRTDFPSKFGIPRQAGLAAGLHGKVVFEPDYRIDEALRGLEGFSHIWLIWGFSENAGHDWTPTVRPPRLGGNVRMGVFATRSPFRPNGLGLSCVRLLEVQKEADLGTTLLVEGADMVDGTPIYDIKPYIPYADSIPDAAGGFAPDEGRLLPVERSGCTLSGSGRRCSGCGDYRNVMISDHQLLHKKQGESMDVIKQTFSPQTAYYDTLLCGLDDSRTVTRLVHGVSWTAAVLSDGSCGVGMHTTGDTIPRMFDTLVGLPVSEAGKAILSWNLEEASEAFAVVNAFYNRSDRVRLRPEAKTLDGIDLTGKKVGMIGHMVGHSNITDELLSPASQLWIMDREEKPGAYPDSAAEFFLPLCDVVIITGSAAINKTMPRLLELSQKAQVILTGPSVSCCPALLELGIDRLHGRVITDPVPMLQAIVERRMSVNAYSVNFQLDRSETL